jgi:hypothetical protein
MALITIPPIGRGILPIFGKWQFLSDPIDKRWEKGYNSGIDTQEEIGWYPTVGYKKERFHENKRRHP